MQISLISLSNGPKWHRQTCMQVMEWCSTRKGGKEYFHRLALYLIKYFSPIFKSSFLFLPFFFPRPPNYLLCIASRSDPLLATLIRSCLHSWATQQLSTLGSGLNFRPDLAALIATADATACASARPNKGRSPLYPAISFSSFSQLQDFLALSFLSLLQVDVQAR